MMRSSLSLIRSQVTGNTVYRMGTIGRRSAYEKTRIADWEYGLETR